MTLLKVRLAYGWGWQVQTCTERRKNLVGSMDSTGSLKYPLLVMHKLVLPVICNKRCGEEAHPQILQFLAFVWSPFVMLIGWTVHMRWPTSGCVSGEDLCWIMWNTAIDDRHSQGISILVLSLSDGAILSWQAKRKRARTPTPGEYLGVRGVFGTLFLMGLLDSERSNNIANFHGKRMFSVTIK